MEVDLQPQSPAIPAGAELILKADQAFKHKGTVFVGVCECELVKIGEFVLAVDDNGTCRGRIQGIEDFSIESLRGATESHGFAAKGQTIGILVYGMWGFEPGAGVRLYRVDHRDQ